jgi:hypothetical protein
LYRKRIREKNNTCTGKKDRKRIREKNNTCTGKKDRKDGRKTPSVKLPTQHVLVTWASPSHFSSLTPSDL